jgi:predicted O-methyltransferase YrrM
MADRSVKAALKRALGPEWQARVHRLSRLRWITKYKLMGKYATDVSPRHRVAYVLLDPETESFTYEVDNRAELIEALSAALGRPESELLAYAAEVDRDPELNVLLSRHVRLRFDVKHRLALGHRLGWYAMVRAAKPALIVETGIYDGLGSLALLRALERNQADGRPGELISIDSNPHAGSIVRDELRANWHPITGLTSQRLLPAIAGRRVDMLFHDTAHTEETQHFEFGAALTHAGDPLVLVDGSGGLAPFLADIAAQHDGRYHRIPVRSRNHIYPGLDIAFAVFERPSRGDPPQ